MKQPVTIKFEEPHEFEKKTYTEITMNPPKRKHDMQAAEMGYDSDVKNEIALFSILCEQPMPFFEEMESCNYMLIQEAYQNFLGKAFERRVERLAGKK